jgi:hypothetical protein
MVLLFTHFRNQNGPMKKSIVVYLRTWFFGEVMLVYALGFRLFVCVLSARISLSLAQPRKKNTQGNFLSLSLSLSLSLVFLLSIVNIPSINLGSLFSTLS